jgi:pimeloyl-ACP methyl ester carboxylesterase
MHHVLEWPAEAPVATVLLIHGYMDAAATWALVAPTLAQARGAGGVRVLAPDLRGFGDAPRVGAGGYYHFPDYVFDVADLVEELVPAGAPLFVVGHSMGGTIANMYAGSFPERVTRLALLEGAGPPDGSPQNAPDRARRWIEAVRAVRAAGERRMPSREDALRRLVRNHAKVPEGVLADHLDALARSVGSVTDGEGFTWKADPIHGTPSPVPFLAEGWKAFASRVTCPVLFVSGGPEGWHPADEDARVSAFASIQRKELPGAGHMMHWTRPADLSEMLLGFFFQ